MESQAPNSARLIGGTSSGYNEIKELEEKKFGENDFKFTSNQVWTVYSDGRIEFNASVSSSNPDVILPRLGWVMNVPKRLNSFTYYVADLLKTIQTVRQDSSYAYMKAVLIRNS